MRSMDHIPIEEREDVATSCLSVAECILNFDFVGVYNDDTPDENVTLHLPTSWRRIIEGGTLVPFMFGLYCDGIGTLALRCLVQLASLRSSIFSSDMELERYLADILSGLIGVIRDRIFLEEEENVHEICRMICRLRSGSFSFRDLSRSLLFSDWFTVVGEFAVQVMESVGGKENSSHYLLHFFSRICQSAATEKDCHERYPFIMETTVKVVNVYLQSHIRYATSMLSESASLPGFLTDTEKLEEMLRYIPKIIRWLYSTLGHSLVETLDRILSDVEQRSFLSPEAMVEMTVATYFSGSVIALRGSMTLDDSADEMDGAIAARVFRILLQEGNVIVEQSPCNHVLQRSFLYFLQRFRSSYVSEQSATTSKFYTKMGELINIATQFEIISLMVSKVVTNLKAYAEDYKIVEESLDLFAALSNTHTSKKTVSKLESIVYFLDEQNEADLPFLAVPTNAKLRRSFYHTLCQLIGIDTIEDEQWGKFMHPMATVAEQLIACPSLSETKSLCTAFVRDMSGVLMACTTRRSFVRLFEWMYPSRTELLFRMAEELHSDPTVMNAMLRFLCDFCTNKEQRISFGSSSPNGILLFKEASKIIVSYCGHSSENTVFQDIYMEKYKPINLCMTILAKALVGRYCNFGVFALYSDPALSSALETCLKAVLNAPLADLLGYRKICKSYFRLLGILYTDHCHLLADLETPVFLQLAASLMEGIRCTDPSVSLQACSGLDHMLTFYHQQTLRGTEIARRFAEHLEARSTLFLEFMRMLIQMLIFEEIDNLYAFSRPVFAMIVVDQVAFERAKEESVSQLVQERGTRILEAFDRLFNGVELNLHFVNRDRFSQNLSLFKDGFRSLA
eukprot:TRINITY_DN3225_c1_g2_i1.p1 TRINITY_DN3225_c1_g2~~TRINITY_DN3225_c1_g2_i1.p1  ORF type:complete len:851 (-),score=194.60 TRINITY_DN3225_c1_g2_i1:100-2652(-)